MDTEFLNVLCWGLWIDWYSHVGMCMCACNAVPLWAWPERTSKHTKRKKKNEKLLDCFSP